MSRSRLRGAAESFEWPPSPADLSTVTVVPTSGASPIRAVPRLVVGADVPADVPQVGRRVAGAVQPRPGPRRRAQLGTMQQLTLLGVGMLVGAALPGLDDGRRPIVGVAAAADASSIAASVGPLQATARDRAVPSPPTATAQPPALATHAAATATASPEHRASAAASSPVAAAHAVPRSTMTPAEPADPRTQQVLRLLRRYETAYSRMDASAAVEVWPSADQEVLTRTFTAMREQRLRLHDCTISGAGAQASGTCRGTLRYRPRVGDHSTRLRYGTWRFAMEREDGRWLIRRVTIS